MQKVDVEALLGSTPSPELSRLVRATQVDLLWRNARQGFIATAIIALILMLSLRSDGAHRFIQGWFAAVLAITIVRLVLQRRYLHQPLTDTERWARWFVLGSGAMGTAWGLLGLIGLPLADPIGRTLIVVTVSGVVAGAVVTNGYIASAYHAFMLPALIALVVGLLRGAAELAMPLAILTAVFGFFMHVSARRVNEAVVGNLFAKHRLELLSRALSAAQHDALTGLPSRSLLDDRLTQAMHHATRSQRTLALLFLDLDGFKAFNDKHGHAAGDIALRTVADRLKHNVRAEDTVARYGGDEFVVLVGDLSKAEDAQAIATKLRTALTLPMHIAGAQLSLGASIGIALYPLDADDAAKLIAYADAAMYRAKQNSAQRIEYHRPLTSAPASSG